MDRLPHSTETEFEQSMPVPSADEDHSRQWGRLSWFLLMGGMALVALNALESVASLHWMPAMWFVNRNLWWLIAVAMVGGGAVLLGSAASPEESSTD
jgi:hypothetical protein